jgi:hypothetical protein
MQHRPDTQIAVPVVHVADTAQTCADANKLGTLASGGAPGIGSVPTSLEPSSATLLPVSTAASDDTAASGDGADVPQPMVGSNK